LKDRWGNAAKKGFGVGKGWTAQYEDCQKKCNKWEKMRKAMRRGGLTEWETNPRRKKTKEVVRGGNKG